MGRRRHGTLSLSIVFSVPLPTNLIVLTSMVYEKELIISKTGEVSTDLVKSLYG